MTRKLIEKVQKYDKKPREVRSCEVSSVPFNAVGQEEMLCISLKRRRESTFDPPAFPTAASLRDSIYSCLSEEARRGMHSSKVLNEAEAWMKINFHTIKVKPGIF